jgi:hypothetical protein
VADQCVLRTVLCNVSGCQSGQHETEERCAKAKPNNNDCGGEMGPPVNEELPTQSPTCHKRATHEQGRRWSPGMRATCQRRR